MKSSPNHKIPEKRQKEWIALQVSGVHHRIRLACFAFLGTYFLAQVLSATLRPEAFHFNEMIPYWVGLVLGNVLVLILNARAKTLKSLKLTAYLFITIFLSYFVIVATSDLSHGLFSMMNICMLILFSITFLIPWRTYDIVLLTALHIFFYTVYSRLMSAPAFTQGFFYIFLTGVLCVIIRHHHVISEKENFLLLKKVEESNEQFKKELELASRIHQTLVPESLSTPKADVHVSYLPMYGVGGDYAKFEFVTEDRLVFMISDVTGHGVSAALMVNRVHTEFQRLVREFKTAGELLKNLNTFILKDFEGTGMYLTAFCGVLDFEKRIFQYSSYGHPPQYHYCLKDSQISSLESQTSFLGVDLGSKDAVYEDQIEFHKGDRLLLFTDGVVETQNEHGEQYGQTRLEEFLSKYNHIRDCGWNKCLIDDLNAYKSGKFQDDIFVLNICVKE